MMKLCPIDDRHYEPVPVYAHALDTEDGKEPSEVETRVWGDGEVVLTYRRSMESLIGIDPAYARSGVYIGFDSYGVQLKCAPEFHAELKRWYAEEFAAGRDHAHGYNLFPGSLMTMASGSREDVVRATFEALTHVICEYEHWNFDRLLGLAA